MTATAEEKKIIATRMPTIRQIKDADLRDRVIEAWVRVWRESGFKDIGDAPFQCGLKGSVENLMRHTNATARMSRAAAREFEKVYAVSLNHDFVLAGAILHDLDKIVMYRVNGNSVEETAKAKTFVHGKYGAEVAEKVGIPPEVVNIIASHSALHPSEPPASAEAVVVAFCDQVSYHSYPFLSGKGVFSK
ncbi:MAG: HDIG domain-containing protein [Dehalococcoidales bacterium]|nr:HDIG domain-containing protein [Dehalococcoidales bacterium]